MKREDFKALTPSKTLAAWCLPVMSRSLAAAEAEREALALFQSVQNLAARQKHD